MKETITWKDANYGFTNGYIGVIRLFSFGHDGTMPKGTVTNTPYKLTCTLPQVDTKMLKDSEACKIEAEKILKQYIFYLKQNMKKETVK